MNEHFVWKCSCGQIVATCKCMDDHKIETIVPNGCTACLAASTRNESEFSRAGG